MTTSTFPYNEFEDSLHRLPALQSCPPARDATTESVSVPSFAPACNDWHRRTIRKWQAHDT